MLDIRNQEIFQSIYKLYTCSEIKNSEELIQNLKNIRFLIKKTYKNTEYEKLLRCSIELLKINKIEMLSNLAMINVRYDIPNVHPDVSKNLVDISIMIQEYLNPQMLKENRLMSLKKINNILVSSKKELSNTKDYPGKLIFLNILSNYLDIIAKESYIFRKRASINLKVLSSRIYYSRKDKVSIPFVISNRGYVDAKKLVITIMNNKISTNSGAKKYKVSELQVEQYKDLNIVIKVDEPGPIDLFAIVSYYVEDTENYKEVYKFSIIAESNGKRYVPVEDNFITGMVVHDETKFIGRKEYIKAIHDSINSTSIIIQGNRRVGKTSLLYRIKNGALGKGIYTIFFDMQQLSIYDAPHDLLKYIVEKIVSHLHEKGFEIEFRKNEKDNLKYKDIARIFENINGILKNNILVLLFDEFEFFEQFINDSNNQFRNLWRSMLINYSNIRYIFSGFLNLNKYSFWTEMEMVTKQIHLDKFTLIDAKNLFELYTGDNIIIEEAALNKIYEASGGHPYLLQCLGSNMVNYVNSIKEPYILLEDVEEIKKRLLVSNNSFFKWLWYSFMDNIEKDEIIKVLRENDPSEPTIILNKNVDKRKLDSLSIEKQMIIISNNKIEFTIPLFKDWITMNFIM